MSRHKSRIIYVGDTGTGKSSIANVTLGYLKPWEKGGPFTVSNKATPETTVVKSKEGHWLGREELGKVIVTDSRGFGDINGQNADEASLLQIRENLFSQPLATAIAFVLLENPRITNTNFLLFRVVIEAARQIPEGLSHVAIIQNKYKMTESAEEEKRILFAEEIRPGEDVMSAEKRRIRRALESTAGNGFQLELDEINTLMKNVFLLDANMAIYSGDAAAYMKATAQFLRLGEWAMRLGPIKPDVGGGEKLHPKAESPRCKHDGKWTKFHGCIRRSTFERVCRDHHGEYRGIDLPFYPRGWDCCGEQGNVCRKEHCHTVIREECDICGGGSQSGPCQKQCITCGETRRCDFLQT